VADENRENEGETGKAMKAVRKSFGFVVSQLSWQTRRSASKMNG
jgi:hypothetical protein